MSITRRTVLRNLGSLTAAQSLAAVGAPFIAGCNHAEKPAPPAPVAAAPVAGMSRTATAIHVAFEGPWILSHDGNKHLVATTFGGLVVGSPTGKKKHTCKVGFPNGEDMVSPFDSSKPCITLDEGKTWKDTTTSTANAKPFDTVVGGVFRLNKALYIGDANNPGNVAPKMSSGDRQVILPMPDSFCLGAGLTQATIYDDTSGMSEATDRISYVAGILQYEDPKVTLSIETNGQTIAVAPGQHLIFRMSHEPKDGMTETDHVHYAFDELMTRVTTAPAQANYHLAPQSSKVDMGTVCDMNAAELGVGYHHAASAPGPKPIKDSNYSNCAGGIIGVGP